MLDPHFCDNHLLRLTTLTPGGCFLLVQVLLRLNLAQLDDMQHGSSFPVVLVPTDKTVAEDSAADPLLFFTHVSQPSRYRGVLYTPTIVGHIAALRLQLSEPLVWRLYSFTQGLASGRSSGSSDASRQASSSAAAAAASARLPASSSRGRLVQAGSSSNLAAAAQGGGGAGNGNGGRSSSAGDVQQVASADLPLQVGDSAKCCWMAAVPQYLA